MLFSEIAHITSGQLLTLHRDEEITTLVLDSRKAVPGQGAVFFAIKGERHDGHEYINAVFRSGVKNFIVELELNGIIPEGANIIRVNSSVKALQQIAAYKRSLFNIPVIGITGSNGKTIIKEWLFQLLSRRHIVAKNPGSYNSQIGVPLSVWQIEEHHTIGVFEAGISRSGEMDILEKIIQPQIGIFTNIGPAHAEGFTNIEQKLLEKLKLFRNVNKVIYCIDQKLTRQGIEKSKLPGVSWGFSDDADIVVKSKGDKFSLRWKEDLIELRIPFQESASLENCLHVIATLMLLRFTPEEIQQGINSLKTVPMRLEFKEGINQSYIIDDTYNNDLAGIEISLQFLTNQRQKKKKTLILSDVLESGLREDELIKKIVDLVDKHQVDRLIGIGEIIYANSASFNLNSRFFKTTENFLQDFNPESFSNEIILIKGARTFQFETIVRRLQRKVHGTVMEIDLGALVHNFNQFKSRLQKHTKVMVMVKAFAYGSGSNEIANMLQFHKADYLGVAYADEGVDLRKNNISLPIMVMNPSPESFDQLLDHKLEPEIYSMRLMHEYIKFLDGRPSTIHIKLDTGMHRLGFEETHIDELLSVLKEFKNLHVASIFSHLAGADESEHDEFSEHQAKVFQTMADRVATVLGYKPLYHLLNSPGIIRHPQFQFDMVRLGIGLYGINPTATHFRLRPVAALKTMISQIKQIHAGDTIGYGRRGIAERDLRVATIAIGYADGYSRAFSRGVGRVLINGRIAPVIGNVCMDMTMVDITEVDANEGDEVIIFGPDLPITEVASWINTIPYEILTNTSERVKRVFVAESL